MYEESERWIENFNDQLLTLGNKVQDFARSALKDATSLGFDLDATRQGNADALLMQTDMLARTGTNVLQDIHTGKATALDKQRAINKKATDDVRRVIDKDELASDTDTATAERTMAQVEQAVQRADERHKTSVATAKD